MWTEYLHKPQEAFPGHDTRFKGTAQTWGPLDHILSWIKYVFFNLLPGNYWEKLQTAYNSRQEQFHAKKLS